MLAVHLFVRYAHINLCHCFSSSWYQGLAATSACGSSWTFLFTFFQYLGIDRIIGGAGHFKITAVPPPAWRLLLRLCVCERECVYLFPIISSNLPATPTHTPVQCAARHMVEQARKNVIDNVHVRTILYRCGHRENVEMFGACNSYHQNQLQDHKNKPTRNWEHTSSLFGAAQNFSASRNILFTYFQVCVIGMASSQKGKNVYFHVTVKQWTYLLWIQNTKLWKVVKNRCGKLRHSRIGSVVQINKRFSWNQYWKSNREWIRLKTD